MKNTLGLATALQGSAALPFVIPRACDFFGADPRFQTELSSRPKRTQISYLAALPNTTYATFCRERRLSFPAPPSSTGNLGERSGVEGPAVFRFRLRTAEMAYHLNKRGNHDEF